MCGWGRYNILNIEWVVIHWAFTRSPVKKEESIRKMERGVSSVVERCRREAGFHHSLDTSLSLTATTDAVKTLCKDQFFFTEHS
jgi:hypothetical protein